VTGRIPHLYRRLHHQPSACSRLSSVGQAVTRLAKKTENSLEGGESREANEGTEWGWSGLWSGVVLCCRQGHEDSPLWYVKLPDDATACRICERSVLVKGMVELWGEGETFEQCRDAAVACPADKKAAYFKPELSFKVRSLVRCRAPLREKQ
jgi:hypothetical protein